MVASGARPCDNADVTRSCELAAAALRPAASFDNTASSLHRWGSSTAAALLEPCDDQGGRSSSSFDLLHPRPLLWLWRYSSRLTKPTAAKTKDANAVRLWVPAFDDNHWCSIWVADWASPCWGWSDVVRATKTARAMLRRHYSSTLHHHHKSNNCNGPTVTWWAAMPIHGPLSLPRVWLGGGRVASGSGDCSTCPSHKVLLDSVATNYPGRVALILLQFPTPYRLLPQGDNDDAGSSGLGNTQVPPDFVSNDFMANPNILRQMARLLVGQHGGGGGQWTALGAVPLRRWRRPDSPVGARGQFPFSSWQCSRSDSSRREANLTILAKTYTKHNRQPPKRESLATHGGRGVQKIMMFRHSLQKKGAVKPLLFFPSAGKGVQDLCIAGMIRTDVDDAIRNQVR